MSTYPKPISARELKQNEKANYQLYVHFMYLCTTNVKYYLRWANKRVISKHHHVKQKRKFIRKAGVMPELPGEAWRGQQARCLISNPRVSMKREAEDIE